MGLFNKGAGIVVPLVFSALILSGMERFSESALAALDAAGREALRNELSQRLVFPYAVMAAGLFLFMLLIHFSSLREPELEAADAPGASPAEVKRWGVFQHPQVVLGAIALFGYVGVEVIAGDTIGLYGRQLGVEHYGVLTSYTMGFMVLGYLLGVALIPRVMSQRAALVFSSVTGLLFASGIALTSPTSTALSHALLGWAGVPPVPDTVLCLALLGLSNALVWPSIWPLALEGLGKYTAAGSALLIMGIAGGALIPMLYGHLADVSTPQHAYWVMLPWYALILFYALVGSRLRRR
jgi:fucose permease